MGAGFGGWGGEGGGELLIDWGIAMEDTLVYRFAGVI